MGQMERNVAEELKGHPKAAVVLEVDGTASAVTLVQKFVHERVSVHLGQLSFVQPYPARQLTTLSWPVSRK